MLIIFPCSKYIDALTPVVKQNGLFIVAVLGYRLFIIEEVFKVSFKDRCLSRI